MAEIDPVTTPGVSGLKMPLIQYQEIRFTEPRRQLIDTANAIINQYTAQGFRLTLRQLYYQLVSRDVIPNSQREYSKLGNAVNDARLAGHIDWTAIEDRTRELGINSHWDKPSDIVESAAKSYHNDLWRFQHWRPEVWVEKDALEGVVESACRPLDVPFFSCRGYTSQTAMWEASQRLLEYRSTNVNGHGLQKPIIFHLGDHDPSGIDMSRDIRARLELFTGDAIEFRRLALNMDQIREYSLPPNPAKTTDSRFQSYVQIYGHESWELDALEPTVLVALIQQNIRSVLDADVFERAKAIQEKGRAELNFIARDYQKAVKATSKV